MCCAFTARHLPNKNIPFLFTPILTHLLLFWKLNSAFSTSHTSPRPTPPFVPIHLNSINTFGEFPLIHFLPLLNTTSKHFDSLSQPNSYYHIFQSSSIFPFLIVKPNSLLYHSIMVLSSLIFPLLIPPNLLPPQPPPSVFLQPPLASHPPPISPYFSFAPQLFFLYSLPFLITLTSLQ